MAAHRRGLGLLPAPLRGAGSFALLGVLGIGDCQCDTTTGIREVTRVTVTTQDTTTFRVGSTVQLLAQALNSNGNSIGATKFSWSSFDENVATVDTLTSSKDARVTGVGPGTVVIEANVTGTSHRARITLTVNPPLIAGILVRPANRVVPIGLPQALTAEAFRSDGSTVSVPFTWTSSNPTIASVGWNPATSDQAVVTGNAVGTSTVTAVEASQPGVTGTTTVRVVALQPGTGVIRGILYDTNGSTPLDSIRLSFGPTAGSTGTTNIAGRTGRQNPGDPVPVPHGGYRYTASAGQYAIFSVGVLGSRYLTTPGDTTFVLAGDTVELNLNIRRGYHLNMLSTNVGTIQRAAGSPVNLVVEYSVWNRDLCPTCSPALAIGVDGTPLAVHRIVLPGTYPGRLDQGVSIPITVPAQGGTIYAMLVTASTASGIQPGLDQYRAVWANVGNATFIRIGTLVVN